MSRPLRRRDQRDARTTANTMVRQLQGLVESPIFKTVTLSAIVGAGVLSGLETSATLLAEHGHWLRLLDRVVLAVFTVEILVKVIAHAPRPQEFFRNGWNIFDTVIVAVCFLPIDSQFAGVLRLARALRLLRLASALPKLQVLAGALLKSLGSMGYVTLLLSLVFYIYGVLGVHFFRRVDPEHFGTLGDALFSLFRLITLDNWTDLYRTATAAGVGLASVYFVSFILLGTMIMLNLFIGIVMNSMAEVHEELEPDRRESRDSLQAQLAEMEKELHGLQSRVAGLRRALSAQADGSPARDRKNDNRLVGAVD